MIDDVPITVDFRLAEHARDWTEEAMSLRPWRAEVFAVSAGGELTRCVGTIERHIHFGLR